MTNPPFPDYYQRWSPSERWESVLFRAGKAGQSAEMNDMQQMLKARAGKVLGYVFQNGQILDGCVATMLSPQSVIISIESPALITWASHGLIAGNPVVFSTTGGLPTGLVAGTTYYVSSATGFTTGAFHVAATYSDAIAGINSIVTTGTQSGAQTAIGSAIVITDGTIFLGGAAYDITGEGLPIPLDERVQVGIRFQTVALTVADDPTLANPAVNTRGFGEEGAAREVAQFRWGWAADGGTRDNYTGWDFYPVFIVDNGVPILRSNPTIANPIINLIASYDRNANGSYLSTGLTASFVRVDGGGNYVYDVLGGTANINGFQVSRTTDTMLVFAPDPDSSTSNNENQTFVPDINGLFTMFTHHSPISSITEIIGETQAVAEAVVHGVSGGQDVLAHSDSLVAVQTITQDATTYNAPTDFIVTGGNIDWSPSGAEPAASSTYYVTYTYLMNPTPVSTGSNYLVFSGLYSGSSIIITYGWKAPRIDALVINADGTLTKIKGVAQAVNPAPPLPSNTQLLIATIQYDWVTNPIVLNVGIRAIQMAELTTLRTAIWDLYQLAADQQLKTDILQTAPSSTLGIFTDGFFDNNQRDLGITQNAFVDPAQNILELAILNPTAYTGDNTANENAIWLLPFTTEIVASQLDYTACLAINPYAVFTPPPAKVQLVPPVDHYVQYNDTVVTTINRTGTRIVIDGHHHSMPLEGISSSRTVAVLSENAVVQQYMRSLTVEFIIDGFLPNEAVSTVTFNGIDVSSTMLPVSPFTTMHADADGHFTGTFVIPANTPAGTRPFIATGAGGSYGPATYIGDFLIDNRQLEIINTTIYIYGDPLAQTFTLPEDRQIASIDVRVCNIGDVTKPVRMQLRTTEVGIPTGVVLGECFVQGRNLVLNAWNNFQFNPPVFCSANTEYAFVILTADNAHALSIARLGDKMLTGPGSPKYITQNPYTIGVLLTSSNASTWLPNEGADLTFRINACVFNPTTFAVQLGNAAVSNLTDFMFAANVTRPSVNCDAVFEADEATPSGGNSGVHKTPENSMLALSYSITDTVAMKVNLSGTTKLSPVLYSNTQMFGGTLGATGTYFSRVFPGNANFNGTVIFESLTPGASSVVPTLAVADVISGVEQTSGGVYLRSYATMTLASRKPVGDGWYEEQWTATGLKGVDPSQRYTAVKLLLTGTPQTRPLCRKLRVFNIAL